MTADYPIRKIFQQFYPGYLEKHPSLSVEKRKTASAIMRCKTGELGFDVSICKDCGKILIHYASCNNRSCPCCQLPQEKKWIKLRQNEVVYGIAYYHVIFTLPDELNQLILGNFVLLCNLMFSCVHETLLTLCADRKYMGAKPGIMTVLHTWGQKLNFHPHIHVCLSGGGLTPSGQFVQTRHKGFLIPEAVIAAMFRGKYLAGVRKLHDEGRLCFHSTPELSDPKNWKDFINKLYSKRWLPFVKETFNGKGNAIEYLARYSYRSAISNARILSVTDRDVTFRYKDYKDNSIVKSRTVSGEDFIHLFLLHVLPKGFNRIRYAGYLTNCCKTRNLKQIHFLIGSIWEPSIYSRMNTAELMFHLFKNDICKCPHCSGKLIHYIRDRPWSKQKVYSGNIITATS